LETRLSQSEEDLEEAKAVAAAAAEDLKEAKAAAEGNKLCLGPGDSFCLNVPSFGGISGGLLVLGIILGLAAGCFCGGRCQVDPCLLCKCCCPSAFGVYNMAKLVTD
jgi:hypothetical protein